MVGKTDSEGFTGNRDRHLSVLKTALVKPVHKAEPITDINNHRPISIPPVHRGVEEDHREPAL